VIELERAVRGYSRDSEEQLAGRIAGVGDGGKLRGDDGDRGAQGDARAGVDGDDRRPLEGGDAEGARGGRARRIGDGEAEAVGEVVGAVVRERDLARVDVVLREGAIDCEGDVVDLERAVRGR